MSNLSYCAVMWDQRRTRAITRLDDKIRVYQTKIVEISELKLVNKTDNVIKVFKDKIAASQQIKANTQANMGTGSSRIREHKKTRKTTKIQTLSEAASA